MTINEITTFSIYAYNTLGVRISNEIFNDIEKLTQIKNLYETKFKNDDLKLKNNVELKISQNNKIKQLIP